MTAKDLYRSVAPDLPVFFRPWWIEAAHNGSWDAAVLEEQGKILAVWPYTIEKRAIFTLVRNPALTAYLGPLWLDKEQATDGWVNQLWSQLPKADFLQWSCVPGLETNTFFTQNGLEYQRKRTFYIDLQESAETLWSKLHPKRKNDIRKAQEDLSISEGFMDVREFTRWHSNSFTEKEKKYPYDTEFLERMIHTADNHNASKAYTAKDKNGHTVAQIWLVYDQDKIYYLLSAAAEHAHRGAVALLIWESIRAAQKMGLKTFDFEGSIDEGIAFFFRRFGGKEMNYDEYALTNSALWKLKQKIKG